MPENSLTLPPGSALPAGSLVLYRGQPARVAHSGERIDLELAGSETARVRAKDVQLIHPGPLTNLAALRPLPGEIRAAWEILAGTTTNLAELAELAFGEFTPQSAWASWQFVRDGLYFSGTPEQITAASVEELEAREKIRNAAAAEERAWREFVERARLAKTEPGDERFLREVEPLAYGAPGRSRLLRDLGKSETPETAHAFLLECGHWSEQVNPYPRRFGMPARASELPVPPLPDEPRLDLTHLAAYAIDDEGTENPDDAISLDGDTLWVHVADPAAVATPNSPLDLDARERGTTLHLPEGAIHLFPDGMTAALGLGLQKTSPALSFAIQHGAQGEIIDVRVVLSTVRVTGMSYEQANLRMDEPLFARLEEMALRRKQRREANGASNIDLPEVKLHVEDGVVQIHPILSLRSRTIVEEAMILTGEAAASYAAARGIPLPFSQQEPPDGRVAMTGPASMFAMRRLMRRSQYRTTPGLHSGLGLPGYAQATSPLRRYLDLVVHQQLRASLRGEKLLSEEEIMERIGAVDAAMPGLRQAEQRSELHWTMVYLLQHPGWQGEGVLVEKRAASGLVIVPELALEARVHLPGDPPLDSVLGLSVGGIHLANLDVSLIVRK